MLSCVPNKKQKKSELLSSTFHEDDKIDESTGPAAKPEIITFYNETKEGGGPNEKGIFCWMNDLQMANEVVFSKDEYCWNKQSNYLESQT